MPQVMRTEDARKIVNQLVRPECQTILRDTGYEVYDWESVKVLREALVEHLVCGELPVQVPLEILESRPEGWATARRDFI